MAAVVWCVLAAIVALLARGLPPRTFFVGDPGVKLIAAQNAVRHPSHPLDIDLPQIAGRPAPFVDRFFRVHGDHAHAKMPELFPLLTAPLLAWFPVRGPYVLPALGLLLALAAIAALGAALDPRRSPALLMLVAMLATPLLFYGLEFWEHAPAVAAAAAATWLLARPGRTDRDLAVAGLLFGVSILLRPEAACYAAACVIAIRLLPHPAGVRDLAIAITAAAITMAPLTFVSSLHGGTWLGDHVSANMSHITSQWLQTRAAVVRAWFGSSARESLWHAAPVAVFAVWPIGSGSPHRGRAFLATVAAVSIALVTLTTPADGGGQWGPRYLLCAFVPLAILVADALQAIANARPRAGLCVAAIALAAGAFVQRDAYKELRATKQTYERAVTFVEGQSPPGGYIVTDLFWLDEIAAVLHPTRTFLVVTNATDAQTVMRMLRDAGAGSVTLMRSRDESPLRFAEDWQIDPPFAVVHVAEIPERTLVSGAIRFAPE